MGFIAVFLINLLIAIVIAELTAKNPTTHIKAKGLDAFNFPTVSADRAIPYCVGDVLIDAPNVTWYGDLRVLKITKKVKKSLFSSSRVTIGFQYFIGMELALGWGPFAEISEIYFGRELAWSGSVTDSSGTGENFIVDAKEIFGGKANGGGVYAECVFYHGSQTQNADSYMTGQVTQAYRHQGLSKLVWKGGSVNADPLSTDSISGLVSESESIHPIKIRAKKYPNSLASGFENINNTANPAEVIFEVLTGRQIFLPGQRTAPYVPDSAFDIPDWIAVAEVLFNEGMGISFQWQQDTLIDDIISDIEEHIEGRVVEDPVTGLIKLKLMRDDYDIETVPSFDEDSIVDFPRFTSNTENTLTAEVILTYTKPDELFKQVPIPIQNSGNYYAQDNISSMNLDLTMFTDPAVAQKRAWTTLAAVSNPIRAGEIVVDRSGWGVKKGDVVKINYAEYKMLDVAARVTKVEFGDLTKRHIVIGFSEDVFSLGDNIFPDPQDSDWEDPNSEPAAVTDLNFFEIPKKWLDTASPNQVALIPITPSGSIYKYDLHYSVDGGVEYNLLDNEQPFSETGLLTIALSADTEYTQPDGLTMTLPSNYVLTTNTSVPDNTFNNIIIINQEILGFDFLNDNGDGTFTTNELYRGLFDTIPASHSVSDRVTPADEINFIELAFADDQDLFFKLVTYSWRGVLDIANATAENYTVVNREQLPYPPADLQINGLRTIPPIFSGDTTISWKERDRNDAAFYRQDAADDGIESGVVTVIEIRLIDDTVLKTFDPAVSPVVYTNADELSDAGFYQSQLKIVAYSKRESNGELSMQQWVKIINKEAPNTPPTAGYNYSADDREITFTDISTDADGTVDSWDWDFGDGEPNSTLQNPVHTYAVNGDYDVTLTVTDDDGDTGQITKSVSATDVNTIPVADFTYSINGTIVTFTDQSTDVDGSVVQWDWDFGDTNTDNVQNPVYDYGTTGVFTVDLIVTDNEAGVSIVKSKTIGVGVSAILLLHLEGNESSDNQTDTVDSRVFVPNVISNYPSFAGDGWGGKIGVGPTFNALQTGSLCMNTWANTLVLTDPDAYGNTFETAELPTADEIKQLMTVDGSASWTFDVWLTSFNFTDFAFSFIDTATDDYALRLDFSNNRLNVLWGGSGGDAGYLNFDTRKTVKITIVYDANVPELRFFKNGVLQNGIASLFDNIDVPVIPAPLGVNEYKLRIESTTYEVSMANLKMYLGALTDAEILADYNAEDLPAIVGNEVPALPSLDGISIINTAADDSDLLVAGFAFSRDSSSNQFFEAFVDDLEPDPASKYRIGPIEDIEVEQVSGDPVFGDDLGVSVAVPFNNYLRFYIAKPHGSGAGTNTAVMRIKYVVGGTEYTADITLTVTHDAAATPPTLGASTNLYEGIDDSSPFSWFKLDELTGTLFADENSQTWLSTSSDIAAYTQDPIDFSDTGASAAVPNNVSDMSSLQSVYNVISNFTAEIVFQWNGAFTSTNTWYLLELGDQLSYVGQPSRGVVFLRFSSTNLTVQFLIEETANPGVLTQRSINIATDVRDFTRHQVIIKRKGSNFEMWLDNVFEGAFVMPSGYQLATDTAGAMRLCDDKPGNDIGYVVFHTSSLHPDWHDRNWQYFDTGSYTP